MKKHIQDLINRAHQTAENHHQMEHAAIAQEHDDLKAKLILAEAELIEREDECDADSEDLSKAIEAVNKVSDVMEYHHGGGATQL